MEEGIKEAEGDGGTMTRGPPVFIVCTEQAAKLLRDFPGKTILCAIKDSHYYLHVEQI